MHDHITHTNTFQNDTEGINQELEKNENDSPQCGSEEDQRERERLNHATDHVYV